MVRCRQFCSRHSGTVPSNKRLGTPGRSGVHGFFSSYLAGEVAKGAFAEGKSKHIIGSREAMKVRTRWHKSLSITAVLGIAAFGFNPPPVSAKDTPLTAIELYDGSAGPAYIQLQNVLINAKIELRNCAPSGTNPIEKSAYNSLEKLTIAVGGVLERGGDGVLRYSAAGGTPICVVPANVKFEHSASISAAAMVDASTFKGDAIKAGTDGSTSALQLKIGVKVVFVAAPNEEQAEFLLAQRIANISGWQNYLAKYPASPHVDEARDTLTDLYVRAGQKALSDYRKSSEGGPPSFPNLKEAKVEEDLAHAIRPDFKSSVELADQIRQILQTLVDKGRAELEAYNSALAAKSAGYGHLEAAKALTDGIAGVDSQFKPGAVLLNDVKQASNTFEAAIRLSALAADANQLDDALKPLLPYRGFADENPRVEKVFNATYKYHFDLGKLAGQGQDWQTSVNEFEKALSTRDTAEGRDSLNEAKLQLVQAQDEGAAKKALAKSQEFEAQKDLIGAYEILAGLTAPQATHLNVADEMKRLSPMYGKAASDKAALLAKSYPEIKGIEDERQIERANDLLHSAYSLSDDPNAKESYQARIETLNEELSAWFLDRAKHFLEKPAGSFTEMGWAYLMEAESYKASNLGLVRDTRTATGPAHAMHSKLSIRVHFVDQTSLREGTGFMHQMEDAIITELEKPEYQATPVRYGETVSGVEPDFHLEGSVLEREITQTPSSVSKESHYRAGTHPITNEEWKKAKREYDSAKDQMQSDQSGMDAAVKANNKKQITEFGNKLSDDRKLASDAEKKMDSVEQTQTVDDTRSYQYTVKTIDIKNSIKLQFSIGRAQSSQMGTPVSISAEESPQLVSVENVKGDDTDGIKLNEKTANTQDLQNALGSRVQKDLTAAVGKKVRDLPQAIYDEGQLREKDEYVEDAGEAYMRYLSVSPVNETTERTHAEQFLRDQFNFPRFPSAAQ